MPEVETNDPKPPDLTECAISIIKQSVHISSKLLKETLRKKHGIDTDVTELVATILFTGSGVGIKCQRIGLTWFDCEKAEKEN